MALHPTLAEAASAFQRGELDRARQLAESTAADGALAAEAEHLLGLIHCRTGDFQSGVAHLRRASEAEPGNSGYRLMLARALIDSGQAADALALAGDEPPGSAAGLAFAHVRAEAATELGDWAAAADSWQAIAAARPGDWRAWSNLGKARAALHSWPEAAEAMQRATQLSPGEAGLRRDLATALAALGRFEDSGEQLDAARALEPANPETHLALAGILRQLGRDEEALAEIEEAERCGADSVEVLLGRGRSLVNLTRFAEAERTYRRAIELSPANAAAIGELGILLERTGRIDELRPLVEAAAEAGVAPEDISLLSALLALHEGDAAEAKRLLLTSSPDADPARWHRLMAKIADALGEPAEAFASATAMNLAVRDYSGWRRRGAVYRKRIRDLGPVLTPEWAKDLPQLPPPRRRAPAFLVGFPRSGTTLLDTFLMGHPSTAVLEEVHLLGLAEQVVGELPDLPRLGVDVLEQAREAYFDQLDRHLDQGFEGLVVDKLPLNMLGMPLIHCLFPDAPIIFAQRHPCDAVLSGFMQSFVLNDAMACFLDIGDAADFYDAAMTLWSLSLKALPLRVHTLRYEDLVSDAAAALRPLIDVLGLEWREELLDHRKTASERGAILTPSYDQVTKPLDSRPVGRWRRYEDELRPVLPVLLPWAERLGYGR